MRKCNSRKNFLGMVSVSRRTIFICSCIELRAFYSSSSMNLPISSISSIFSELGNKSNRRRSKERA